MSRNLTPAERDSLLEKVADGVVDGVDRLTAIEARLSQIEASTGATLSAIMRESLRTIFDNTLKTSALFAFLTVCVIIGGAIYLNSEAALLAIAQRAGQLEEPIVQPHHNQPEGEADNE
jgi:lipopolysaccharide/colanic/teichoic acid biosynthesis glycosyltransferase